MKFVFWLSMLAIAGCATRTPVPVTERAPLPARPPAAAAPESPVPPATVLAPAPVEPEVPTYVVRRGDTLGKIAADNAISSRDLAAWNNIDNPHLLRPGQVLRLRPPTASDASLAASPTPLAGADGSGVLTAPLRTPPPVVESPAGGVPSRSTGAMPSGGSAPAAAPSRALAEGLKTEPKGIRLPYSEQAVAQLQRGAAPGSASPDTGRARAPASTPAPATPAVPLAALASPPTQAAASPSLPTPVKPAVPAPAPGSAPPPASPAPATASAAPGASAATPSAALANEEDSIDWIWPTTGKVLSGFSEGANTKGIDIAGRPGQPVVAVADGRVVYAGSGLRGYGKLIIIKHNKTYISAYAHNSQIHVKEGQQVTRGQRIADMGDSDADQVKLHFEIRRMGKPVDPSRYLPPG